MDRLQRIRDLKLQLANLRAEGIENGELPFRKKFTQAETNTIIKCVKDNPLCKITEIMKLLPERSNPAIHKKLTVLGYKKIWVRLYEDGSYKGR